MTPSLDIPLVGFGDGDESKLRYTNETGKLLRKGYDEVCYPISRPIFPILDCSLLTITNSMSNMDSRF